MDEGTDNQLFAESSATYTSTFQPVNQLAVQAQARFSIAQPYIDVANALSEAVPPIAPDLQKIISPVANQRDIQTLFRLKDADIEPSNTTVMGMRQEVDQINTSIQVIANDYRNMLMEYFAEPLRQSRMSFNVAHWLVPGFLISGLAIILIGIISALVVHNAIVSVPTTIGGGIVQAIGIIRANTKDANDRLDQNKKHLLALTQYFSAGEYIEKITDVELKDKSYAELAKEITDLSKRI